MEDQLRRQPECKAQFGSSEYIHVIPACMGGSALVGCARLDLCDPSRESNETPVSVPASASNARVLAQMGLSENIRVVPREPRT
jgi:hypothetical protein